jgi:hypothetical protein
VVICAISGFFSIFISHYIFERTNTQHNQAMNFSAKPVSRLFGIEYPIVQAGMIWASGWKLASAVSNAGGLGMIGAGSMYPQVLQEHIIQCKMLRRNHSA